MNDDRLQHEIEHALDVEPTPQFVARVRQHLLEGTVRRPALLHWKAWTGGLVTAAVVAGILLYEPPRPAQVMVPTTRATVVEVPAPREIPVVETHSRKAPPRAATIGKMSKEPEVLVDPREAAAFRNFVNDIRDERIDPARLNALFDAVEKLRAVDKIQPAPIVGLEPIEVPPLIPVAPEKEGGSL